MFANWRRLVKKHDTSKALWKHFLVFAVRRSRYLRFPTAEWTKSLNWHLHWKAFHRAFCQAFQAGMKWMRASLQMMHCWMYVGANSHHYECRWERKMNRQGSLRRWRISLLMDYVHVFNEVLRQQDTVKDGFFPWSSSSEFKFIEFCDAETSQRLYLLLFHHYNTN